MVAGACSPVDWMYVTPKPAIATFFMAKNHSKTITPPPPCRSPPQGRRSPTTPWGTVTK